MFRHFDLNMIGWPDEGYRQMRLHPGVRVTARDTHPDQLFRNTPYSTTAAYLA